MSNKIIRRIELLESDSHDNDEHYLLRDHLGGLICWTILVLVGVTIIIFLARDNRDVTDKPYYEDSSQFCQHFNMSVDGILFSQYRCAKFTNDTVRYYNIQKVNNRWVFVEYEEKEK